jgi:hypothetical protein
MEELRDLVGRSTEVHLETVEPLPDSGILERIPHVSCVDRIADNEFHIILKDQKDLDGIVDQTIRTLLAEGKHIHGIYPTRQSLESLYLSYTDAEGGT